MSTDRAIGAKRLCRQQVLRVTRKGADRKLRPGRRPSFRQTWNLGAVSLAPSDHREAQAASGGRR